MVNTYEQYYKLRLGQGYKTKGTQLISGNVDIVLRSWKLDVMGYRVIKKA